ncbi:hypothetical protein RRG08_062505 [Elysia crispata]|uniref:Uncharacterized protein n=1 Tax=Elysia crispata TaxID=231223 RepID=A0AAE0ZXM3_9GAST|nr:hypothetical protein RRG08_062505 [Elysia crispata]
MLVRVRFIVKYIEKDKIHNYETNSLDKLKATSEFHATQVKELHLFILCSTLAGTIEPAVVIRSTSVAGATRPTPWGAGQPQT